ncbi:MAG: SPASM domain-containing protein, partial [Myxococcota bacterium]
TCGDVPVVEHTGDFYSCDHFVVAAHRVGNIRETRLLDLVEDPAQRAFGEAKWETLPGTCRRCSVLSMCHGGCPKDRILETEDGEPGLNYLCAGYKRFFTHVRPYGTRLAALRRARRAPEQVMQAMRAEDSAAFPKAGRNDPCPCGSGKKYKRCCLGKR